jgi:hypothetical protein
VVTKKKRKKGPLFEGKKLLKKEGMLGKQRSKYGRRGETKNQTGTARST